MSSTVVYLANRTPLEQERLAVLLLGEIAAMQAPIASGWTYREAWALAATVTDAPAAFGLSEQFAKVEGIASGFGVVWYLNDRDPSLAFRVETTK